MTSACLILWASAPPALAQDRQRHAGLAITADTLAAASTRPWRTVTLGTVKGAQAYRQALEVATIRIGDSANEILGRPRFAYQKMKSAVDLVLVTGAELGLPAGQATLAELYGRAKQMGLDLCPAQVGPQLRVDYADQPVGEFIHVAMEPVATYAGQPTILALANAGSGLLLLGSDGRSDYLVTRSVKFVFALPPSRSPADGMP